MRHARSGRLSHAATVALTTRMFRHFSAGRSKAEALRRSMLQLMRRKGELPYAHPMLWAPFVIEGNGDEAVGGVRSGAARRLRRPRQAPRSAETGGDVTAFRRRA